MSTNNRNKGIELLQLSSGSMHVGTGLRDAANYLYLSFEESTDRADKAIDIVHCGVCFWFAALAFFRLGAKSNIQQCKSGAPEELLLTLVLRRDEYDGGDLGSRLRSIVTPIDLENLRKCLAGALFCYDEAEKLGAPGLASLWRAALFRGTGDFVACESEAAQVSNKPGIATSEIKEVQDYTKGIPAYKSDLQWITTHNFNCIVAADKWTHPEVLQSMTEVPLIQGIPQLDNIDRRHDTASSEPAQDLPRGEAVSTDEWVQPTRRLVEAAILIIDKISLEETMKRFSSQAEFRQWADNEANESQVKVAERLIRQSSSYLKKKGKTEDEVKSIIRSAFRDAVPLKGDLRGIALDTESGPQRVVMAASFLAKLQTQVDAGNVGGKGCAGLGVLLLAALSACCWCVVLVVELWQ